MIPNDQSINAMDITHLDFAADRKRYLFLAKKDKTDFILIAHILLMLILCSLLLYCFYVI